MSPELRDILAEVRGPEPFHGKVLCQLKELAEARGCEFVEGKEEWGLTSFVRPRKRTFFGIEDKTKGRAILGVILVPTPKREHSDQAWNRIEPPLRDKLLSFETGSMITCLFLQVWEAERRVVLIPLNELKKLKGFRDTGDFNIKKRDGREFFLVTPRWEDNIKLKDSLDGLSILFGPK